LQHGTDSQPFLIHGAVKQQQVFGGLMPCLSHIIQNKNIVQV